MNLPKDPVMLLSVVNTQSTQLRDNYENLTELAKSYMVSEEELIERLRSIQYEYNKETNQFV